MWAPVGPNHEEKCPDFRGVFVLHWDPTKCPVYKRYPDRFQGCVCIALGPNEVSSIQEVS